MPHVSKLDETPTGEAVSSDQLIPSVYRELRRIAASHLAGEAVGVSLNATDLIHEAYLRLGNPSDDNWHSRSHFLIAAGEAMRRILIDRARRKKALKHGGGRNRTALDEVAIEYPADQLDLLALDEALDKLEVMSDRYAKIVKLRSLLD